MESIIHSRKNEHILLALKNENDLADRSWTGFHHYRFEHLAAPEIDFAEVDTSITLFGKKLSAPLIIGAMTGGTEQAFEINKILAKAAEARGIGMALGSQRAMLEDAAVTKSFAVKNHAPALPLLFGNIGAVQLNLGVNALDVSRLIATIGADAFHVHFNPLQEIIQKEGDRNFSALLEKVECVADTLKNKGIHTPLLVKEIGSGISATSAKNFAKLSLAGIEVAGLGGTSWAKIESQRSQSIELQNLGQLFSDWGISTTDSIQNARKYFSDRIVLASGGIRNGIEIAKSLNLGADACSLSRPFLISASSSLEETLQLIDRLVLELKTTMFLTGSKNIFELKQKELVKMI